MEEAWELAALDVSSLKIISLFSLAVISACANDTNVNTLEDVESAINTTTTAVSAKERKGQLEQLTSNESDVVKEIIIEAEPYMDANFNQRYDLIFIRCNFDQTMNIDLRSFPSPPERNEDGLVFRKTGEVMFGRSLSQFWQNPIVSVFFDGVQVISPPMYKTIIKQVQIDGQYVTRSERQLINKPSVLFAQHFLPKLKGSKIMRIDHGQGIGPVFELDDVHDKIEKLETQCVLKDLQE